MVNVKVTNNSIERGIQLFKVRKKYQSIEVQKYSNVFTFVRDGNFAKPHNQKEIHNMKPYRSLKTFVRFSIL